MTPSCEVREYVLEKHDRKCAYCSVTGVPLNLDHVEARARGGSNRPSSIVPACIPCNKAKGAMPIEEFLAGKPKRLAAIKANLKAPLRDAAAVNATWWALWEALRGTGLPVEASTAPGRSSTGIASAFPRRMRAAPPASARSRRWRAGRYRR